MGAKTTHAGRQSHSGLLVVQHAKNKECDWGEKTTHGVFGKTPSAVLPSVAGGQISLGEGNTEHTSASPNQDGKCVNALVCI